MCPVEELFHYFIIYNNKITKLQECPVEYLFDSLVKFINKNNY